MTITLRTTKGSALTFNEMDDNFRETLDLRRIHTDQVTAGGTADALTANFSRAVSLSNGVMIKVKIASANTVVGPTLNVNSTGAKTITGLSGSPVGAGSLPAGAVVLFSYDSGSDSWMALNFSSTDATTLNGQPASYYLDADNIDAGTIGAAYLPQATTTTIGATRYATAAEVATGTETQAAVTPNVLNSIVPTINYFTGTTSISGLTAGKVYAVSVYGILKNRGNGDTTLGAIAVVDGTSTSGTTVLATTGTTSSVNWPDGQAPASHTLIVTPTSSDIAGVVDRVSSADIGTTIAMTAIQLT